jgi:hypothetical protein
MRKYWFHFEKNVFFSLITHADMYAVTVRKNLHRAYNLLAPGVFWTNFVQILLRILKFKFLWCLPFKFPLSMGNLRVCWANLIVEQIWGHFSLVIWGPETELQTQNYEIWGPKVLSYKFRLKMENWRRILSYPKKKNRNSSAADDIHLREMIWKTHFPAPRYNFFFSIILHFYDLKSQIKNKL